MIRRSLIAALLLTSSGCISVDPTGKADGAKDILDLLSDNGVRLRGSPDPVQKAFQDPAKIQRKNPSGNNNGTGVVDLAVLWEHQLGDTPWVLAPQAEYHRNNTGTQDVESYGAGIGIAYYDDEKYQDRHWELIHRASVSVQRDRVQDSEGLRLKMSSTYIRQEWIRGPSTKGSGKLLTFQPTAGILCDEQNKVAGDSGVRVSWFASGISRFYLLPKIFVDHLYVETSLSYWDDLISNGGYADVPSTSNLFKSGLNVILDRAQRVALALEYSNGENPEVGQPTEEAVILSLKFKL